MYVYKITNLLNNKIYIGITNSYKRRFREHSNIKDPKSLIAKAIQKYGKENFSFEVLYRGLSIEESCEKEIELIKKFNSLTPNGYNISKGGNVNIGTGNGKALLTEEEVKYIKSHRNIPMYVLYEQFNEKITYRAFQKVYHNKTYIDIIPTVECYPYNLEFSNQFTSNNNLDYEDIVKLREMYNNHIS